MRTARKRQVVAFKSFLRTLCHELCHHLDYELFALEETFHTDGFYKRESSLANALLASEANPAAESGALVAAGRRMKDRARAFATMRASTPRGALQPGIMPGQARGWGIRPDPRCNRAR